MKIPKQYRTSLLLSFALGLMTTFMGYQLICDDSVHIAVAIVFGCLGMAAGVILMTLAAIKYNKARAFFKNYNGAQDIYKDIRNE